MPKEILIVDDDPDFVETMEIILQGNGYKTRTARNGEEAFEKVKEKIPDIILLDIMMKTKTDGIWVSEKIRSDMPAPSRVPRITTVFRGFNYPVKN